MSDIATSMQAGLEHHRAGRLPEAEEMYRNVLAIHPRHAGALHMLGLLAFQVGKAPLAEQYLTEAVKIDGYHAPYRADLGEVLRAQGKVDEAIAAYRKALELNPELPEAQARLGTLLQATGQVDEAIAELREALSLNPSLAEAHCGLGDVLFAQGDLAAAHAEYEQTVSLEGEQAANYLRLGSTYAAQGNQLSAIACFQKAVRLEPQLAEAHYRMALARLTQGDYERGWREFEWRLQLPQLARRDYRGLPRWNGGPLDGQTVVLHSDRGLSDAILLVRYARLARQRGGNVILDVQPELIPLVQAAELGRVLAADETSVEAHLQAPLASLPGIFATTPETVPGEVPYLAAPLDAMAHWRQRLAGVAGFRVAVVSRPDAGGLVQRLGTIPAEALRPLAAVPGVALIHLQRAAASADAGASGAAHGELNLEDELAAGAGVWVNAAAVTKNVDLVIATDGALAQLAGALGVNVWIVLSTAADWRWLELREDSPWYPTARLFRQRKLGDWGEVVTRMASALAGQIARRGRP